MTDANHPPSAWRLLWSPKAMAWWACYRPVFSLRLGILVIGLWFGYSNALAIWYLLPEEPFLANSKVAHSTVVVLWLLQAFLLTIFAFGVKSSRIEPGRFTVWLVLPLAVIPSAIIFTPGELLDGALHVEELAAIGYSQTGFTPVYPSWLVILRAAWPSVWASSVVSLAWMLIATHHAERYQKQASASLCQQCRYDLTGTRKAGIERCPECGTAVEPLEVEAVTNNTKK